MLQTSRRLFGRRLFGRHDQTEFIHVHDGLQEMFLAGYMLKSQMMALIPFLKENEISFSYAVIEAGGTQRVTWESIGMEKIYRVNDIKQHFPDHLRKYTGRGVECSG
jgi:hypothetical protein